MHDWLETLKKIKKEVPDDVLVLPSHNECFRGLHARLDYLAMAQERTMDRLRKTLKEPRRAIDVFVALFGRSIDETDGGLLNLATGESIACLNYLSHRGEITRQTDNDGVVWYQIASGQTGYLNTPRDGRFQVAMASGNAICWFVLNW